MPTVSTVIQRIS